MFEWQFLLILICYLEYEKSVCKVVASMMKYNATYTYLMCTEMLTVNQLSLPRQCKLLMRAWNENKKKLPPDFRQQSVLQRAQIPVEQKMTPKLESKLSF